MEQIYMECSWAWWNTFGANKMCFGCPDKITGHWSLHLPLSQAQPVNVGLKETEPTHSLCHTHTHTHTHTPTLTMCHNTLAILIYTHTDSVFPKHDMHTNVPAHTPTHPLPHTHTSPIWSRILFTYSPDNGSALEQLSWFTVSNTCVDFCKLAIAP